MFMSGEGLLIIVYYLETYMRSDYIIIGLPNIIFLVIMFN